MQYGMGLGYHMYNTIEGNSPFLIGNAYTLQDLIMRGSLMGLTFGPTNHVTKGRERAILDGLKYQILGSERLKSIHTCENSMNLM